MAVEPSRPGLRTCMKCGRMFESPDYERIRRCEDCHKDEEKEPRVVKMADVGRAIRTHFRGG